MIQLKHVMNFLIDAVFINCVVKNQDSNIVARLWKTKHQKRKEKWCRFELEKKHRSRLENIATSLGTIANLKSHGHVWFHKTSRQSIIPAINWYCIRLKDHRVSLINNTHLRPLGKKTLSSRIQGQSYGFQLSTVQDSQAENGATWLVGIGLPSGMDDRSEILWSNQPEEGLQLQPDC